MRRVGFTVYLGGDRRTFDMGDGFYEREELTRVGGLSRMYF